MAICKRPVLRSVCVYRRRGQHDHGCGICFWTTGGKTHAFQGGDAPVTELSRSQVRPNQELPSTATLEVIIRPVNGVAGTSYGNNMRATVREFIIKVRDDRKGTEQPIARGSESSAAVGRLSPDIDTTRVASKGTCCCGALSERCGVSECGICCAAAGRLSANAWCALCRISRLPRWGIHYQSGPEGKRKCWDPRLCVSEWRVDLV